MSFTLKQLRAFVAVADSGNFRVASDALHLSPAAVSLLVRELEATLGFAVFERTTRRVVMSRAGREFLPAAQRVLREIQSTERSAKEVRARTVGSVRVAASPAIATVLLPQAIAEFQIDAPEVAIKVVDFYPKNVSVLVEGDEADLGIEQSRPVGSAVQRLRLYSAPWCLWCSANHDLASHGAVRWSELKTHALITSDDEFEHRMASALGGVQCLDGLLPTHAVGNVMTALGLAAAGLGVMVAPSHVQSIAQRFGLIRKELVDPATTEEISLYKPRERAKSAAVETFERFLIQRFSSPYSGDSRKVEENFYSIEKRTSTIEQ